MKRFLDTLTEKQKALVEESFLTYYQLPIPYDVQSAMMASHQHREEDNDKIIYYEKDVLLLLFLLQNHYGSLINRMRSLILNEIKIKVFLTKTPLGYLAYVENRSIESVGETSDNAVKNIIAAINLHFQEFDIKLTVKDIDIEVVAL